jgi:uncharacterized damage-inducible protein DinB
MIFKNPMNACLILDAVGEVLQQGESLLARVGDSDYRTKVATAFNASIGGHYRHCLDHFQIVLEAVGQGEVNYDLRRRDPRIESEREYAMQETARLRAALSEVPLEYLSRPMNVRCKVSYGDAAVPLVGSTVEREFMFAISHAVHHFALIGIMCSILGLERPEGFGVAPSTLQHHSTTVR